MASIGCVLAPSMELLIGWRTLQGVAMGAAVMGARAIVRDLYGPEAGARAMSRGLSGLGVIACIGPALGGVLADRYGWRSALAAAVAFGAIAFALVAARFEETLHARSTRAPRLPELVATWAQIVRHPTFLACSALATASCAGLFTFLASSSFVFIQVLGFTRTAYGLVMSTMAFTYLSGTFLCRRLLPRIGLRRTVAVAGALSPAGGTTMSVFALAGWHNGWASCCRSTCSWWRMACTSPARKAARWARSRARLARRRHSAAS